MPSPGARKTSKSWKAGRFELLNGHLRETHQEFIAQVMVDGALVAQTSAVERNRAGRFDGVSVKVPSIGGYQPIPAENISVGQRLDHDSPTLGSVARDSDLALPNQIKPIGIFVLPRNRLAYLEDDVAGATDQ